MTSLSSWHSSLRYLNSSHATDIFFHADNALKLHTFVDSYWARCPDKRKYITSFYVLLGSSLICWKLKKQPIVSRSTTEAEYMSLASLTCELQWLHNLFKDLNINFSKPASIYYDNKSTIYLEHNPTSHERTKHIELDFHVIREKINSKLIHLLPI